MAKERIANVTMRVRIGDNELEVTGPNNYVEEQIEQFYEKYKNSRTDVSAKSMPPESAASIEKGGKEMSSAQFFKKINPTTDLDRTLTAGYYLEIIRKYDSFTSGEIRALIKEAKRVPPQNPSDAINKNIRKGYMMSAGDKEGMMAFVLTSDGEEAIANILKQ